MSSEKKADDIEAIRIREVSSLIGDYSPEKIDAWVRAGKFPRDLHDCQRNIRTIDRQATRT